MTDDEFDYEEAACCYYEEDETTISEDEIFFDGSSGISRLTQIVQIYNAFIFQYPASIDPNGMIKLLLPSNVLPLAQQFVYGFHNEKVLLNIEIELDNYQWCYKPIRFSALHPVYRHKYIGYPLIQDVVKNFFDPLYRPSVSYSSSSMLLRAMGQIDIDVLNELVCEGHDTERVEQALSICKNDINLARSFLRTGEIPSEQLEVDVKFTDCPLLYLIFEIIESFLEISDHCCICRAKLHESTVKPTTCSNSLCEFGFSNLGVGTSLITEIRRDPLVADLLISCFSAAINTTFLTPIPPNNDRSAISKIVTNLPPIKELIKYQDDIELISSIGEMAVSLIKWILLTNKSQLISLPNQIRIPEFSSKYQFLTLMSSIEKEKQFQNLKAQYGSIFLWHGSNGCRWHSIIRSGLRNATGTALQAHGSAFGPGIYYARNLFTSKNYSTQSQNLYIGSVFGKSLQLVGLCEVAKVPNLYDKGWAHVCENEEASIVRILLVSANFNYDIISSPIQHIPNLKDILEYYASQ